MTTFPIHVYKSPGNYVRRGMTYKIASAADQKALQAFLDDGWHLDLASALEAAGEAAKHRRPRADWRTRKAQEAKAREQRQKEREASLAAYAARKAEPPQKPAAPDDAPPTREELEQKATELGLKFDGRTSDKRLLARIETALKEPV